MWTLTSKLNLRSFLQVNWLKKIGLTAAEACGLMATYPPFSRVRLDVMKTGGVALLNDELQLASEQVAKVWRKLSYHHSDTRLNRRY